MNLTRVVIPSAATLILLLSSLPAIGQVAVDPVGITVAAELDDSIAVEMTITNDYQEEVAFSVNFDEPPEEEERQRGPRRDDVDLDGLMFAVFQDQQAWNWFDVDMFDRDPQIDEDMYDSYRNAGAWNDVDFEDYDAIVVAACNQSANFNNNYNDNYDRFCEYIDGGGAAYFETGNQNSPIHSPGDIINNTGGESNGRLAVSPDPEDENYSLFAEICQESQENDDWWNFGYMLQGNAHAHSGYQLGQFEDDDNIEWFQVIVDGWNDHNLNLGVAYGYGRGMVFTHGGPTGWNWNHWPNPGQWGSIAAELLLYLSEMTGPKWILTDPEEGVIGAEDSETVNIIFNPVEIEDGVYEMRILIELEEANEEERDQLDQSLIEISAVMSLGSPVVDLSGTITDAATDETIEGANVALDAYIVERFSDGEGLYSFTELPLQAYELTCTATDYLPLVEAFDPDEAGEYELNVALLHSECNIDRESIEEELPFESETHVQFQVSNDGNGDLEYSVERRLLGDANADPWELRRSYNSSDTLEDSRLEGVIFDGDYFYIAGANMWNREDGENMIYVVNRDGGLEREFEQAGESNFGMRDLAWDGELIWGSGEATVFGFTTDGEPEVTFQGPNNNNQALAWDPDRELLWIASITTNISGYTRDGEFRSELDRNGFRIYGLAYWPEDPDGYPLYIYHSPEANVRLVYKMNPDDGDTMFVAQLDPEASGRAAGAFITNQFDVYSWVMISLVNDGANDQVQIWQLDARKDWMRVNPVEGIIEAGAGADFDLLLSSHGLPPVLFEGELVFLHNGVGAETHLPVSLNVIDENPPPRPPSEFNLLEPVNNDTLSSDTVQTFIWESSIDPDPEDVVSYLIWFQAMDDSIWFAVEDTTWDARPDTLLAEYDPGSPVTWWVVAVSDTDTVECNDRFIFYVRVNDVDVSGDNLPGEFAIRSVHPNPFNARTTVGYSLTQAGQTRLTLFDFAGREVSGYDYGVKQAGYHSAVIDAGALPSGLYIVQLTCGAEVRQAKMVCIK